MIVLGIETSCDETAAALVENGRHVLASVVYSQIATHRPHGGVVPEIASREHTERLPDVVSETMRLAAIPWRRLDAVAVTYGPGLASSLLIGLAGAKALALRCGVGLIGVNHLEAHVNAVFLGDRAPADATLLPARALVVSGGHTSLLRVAQDGTYRCIGRTLDDAAGEAFDKGAVLMGLEYPGGPAIEAAARGGNPRAVAFPRGLQRQKHKDKASASRYDFSFSGLKTALLYYLRDKTRRTGSEYETQLADIAASYQEAIVDVLVNKTLAGLDDERAILMAGGVALNGRLREAMTEAARRRGIACRMADPDYCADNAAMIAALAGRGGGRRVLSVGELDAQPSLVFDQGRLWAE